MQEGAALRDWDHWEWMQWWFIKDGCTSGRCHSPSDRRCWWVSVVTLSFTEHGPKIHIKAPPDAIQLDGSCKFGVLYQRCLRATFSHSSYVKLARVGAKTARSVCVRRNRRRFPSQQKKSSFIAMTLRRLCAPSTSAARLASAGTSAEPGYRVRIALMNVTFQPVSSDRK